MKKTGEAATSKVKQRRSATDLARAKASQKMDGDLVWKGGVQRRRRVEGDEGAAWRAMKASRGGRRSDARAGVSSKKAAACGRQLEEGRREGDEA